jgi:ubiquinol-cytochrome c reductase cytochrome b subunit
MLKLVPSKFLGIMLQVAAVFLFLAWPFLDRKEERNILKRPLMLAAFIGILIVWTVLTLWGKYS